MPGELSFLSAISTKRIVGYAHVCTRLVQKVSGSGFVIRRLNPLWLEAGGEPSTSGVSACQIFWVISFFALAVASGTWTAPRAVLFKSGVHLINSLVYLFSFIIGDLEEGYFGDVQCVSASCHQPGGYHHWAQSLKGSLLVGQSLEHRWASDIASTYARNTLSYPSKPYASVNLWVLENSSMLRWTTEAYVPETIINWRTHFLTKVFFFVRGLIQRYRPS